MGLLDFLKSKKRKKESGEVLSLGDVDSLEIDPPETRYTQEYRDFLASREAAEKGPADAAGDPAATEEPFPED